MAELKIFVKRYKGVVILDAEKTEGEFIDKVFVGEDGCAVAVSWRFLDLVKGGLRIKPGSSVEQLHTPPNV